MRVLSILALLGLAACSNNKADTPAEADKANTPAEEAAKADAPADGTDADGVKLEISTETPTDVAEVPADAQKTESGLAYKVIKANEGGESPSGASSVVTVHYSGWTTDGNNFDSSVSRNKATQFPLNRVIAGWTEGLQLMKTGEVYRLWIPEELAYKGRPGKPAGMLVFDVQLLEVSNPPAAPADVAAAPADASKTESGLAYKILEKGEGTENPSATSKVTVHYTGWTTDGEMFDSSVMRGKPATFPLDRVIPGWTEGLQLMQVGDKARLWIPEEMAYKGRPGAPQGMLVFDVELLEIAAPATAQAPKAEEAATKE